MSLEDSGMHWKTMMPWEDGKSHGKTERLGRIGRQLEDFGRLEDSKDLEDSWKTLKGRWKTLKTGRLGR